MTERSSWDLFCGEHELRAVRPDVRHPFNSEANGFALQLDDITIMVFEDPSDGYRSSAAAPIVHAGPMYELGADPEYIRAPVLVRRWTEDSYGVPDGIELIDRRNGKTLLRLGTANHDDYYPSFTCEWTPKNLADNAVQQS